MVALIWYGNEDGDDYDDDDDDIDDNDDVGDNDKENNDDDDGKDGCLWLRGWSGRSLTRML